MTRLLSLALLVVWCLVMSERDALAYMDPGSGSMLLQLVLGGVAGLVLIGKLYWQKFLTLIGIRRHDADSEPQ
ncbi:MAG TPA: hypothetical protein VFK20_13660 [Vicinamibacterales bacterium]|jgi:hypothetical protein|nr:hypothetical protein [Vicinamibacterales bacterium]